MARIKGKVYQLAGFALRIHGRNKALSDVFAVFCGLNEDRDNPPQGNIARILDKDYQRPLTRYIKPDALVTAFVFFNDVARPSQDDNFIPAREIALDLGPEKLRQVIALMSRLASAEQIPGTDQKHNECFIPVSKLGV